MNFFFVMTLLEPGSAHGLQPISGAHSGQSLIELMLSIPTFLRVVVLLLGFVTLTVWGVMEYKKRKILSALDQFEHGLPQPDPSMNHAPSRSMVEGLRSVFQGNTGPQARWWHRLEQHLQVYQGRAPREGMYVTVAAEEALPESEVIDPYFPSGKFQIWPGLITSLGLAATFLAILIGLSGVRPDPNVKGAFEGIEGLIGSLGGKFATSIVALVCGALLTFLERQTERRLQKSYDAVVQRVARIFPLLTSTRVLVDIQHSAVEREKALRNISSEVVDQLRDVFTKEVTPHFANGMVGAMKPSFDGMAETLADLEVAIQGMGSLKPMRDLQEQMAVMGKTMMHQFEDVQSQAGNRAAEEVGKITAAVHAAENQIASLMELLTTRSQDLVHLGSQLENAGENLKGLLEGASSAADSMTTAAKAFGLLHAGLIESVASAQTTTVKQQETLSKLGTLFNSIQAQYERGAELLINYRETFSTAQAQLSHLDQDLGGAFSVVHQGMEAWTQGVDNTMRQLTARTNEHMGGIARSLGAQLETLNENLQEFNDTLSQVIEQRQA